MAQNLYETMFVLKPTLTPEETQARINFVKESVSGKLLEKQSGKRGYTVE